MHQHEHIPGRRTGAIGGAEANAVVDLQVLINWTTIKLVADVDDGNNKQLLCWGNRDLFVRWRCLARLVATTC